MRRIGSFCIGAGIIGIVGPFFGIGLRGVEDGADFGVGAILLVVGVIFVAISNSMNNHREY